MDWVGYYTGFVTLIYLRGVIRLKTTNSGRMEFITKILMAMIPAPIFLRAMRLI